MRALGMEPAVAWVPHPIQNRNEQELASIANDAIDEIVRLISA